MKPIVTTEDNGTQESLNIDDNYPVLVCLHIKCIYIYIYI